MGLLENVASNLIEPLIIAHHYQLLQPSADASVYQQYDSVTAGGSSTSTSGEGSGGRVAKGRGSDRKYVVGYIFK